MSCCKQNLKRRTLEDLHFTPKYSEKLLTEKFYSKYENVKQLMQGNSLKSAKYFAEEIQAYMNYDRKDFYFAPMTANQLYGWYERYANYKTMDKADRELLSHPMKTDEVLSILGKITFEIRQERNFKLRNEALSKLPKA